MKHVILTHAHWDDMGGMNLFPNATFYLQREELTNWITTMALPREYNTLKAFTSYTDIEDCVGLLRQNRLVLLDGDVDNLFPGIHIRVGRNGHTFAMNLVLIESKGQKYIIVGDAAYVKGNIMGGRGDGVSMPNGCGAGSVFNMIHTLQDILKTVDGNIDNVLIGHEVGTWEQYESEETSDGLHIARIIR